jgi:hypothetical protein
MSGAIPQLSHYAFMVWCSAKAQGQLYLSPLPLLSSQENIHIQKCRLFMVSVDKEVNIKYETEHSVAF